MSDCKICNIKMENEEEFVCKVKFRKGAPDGIEVIEGDERRCRELFKRVEDKFTFPNKEEDGKA